MLRTRHDCTRAYVSGAEIGVEGAENGVNGSVAVRVVFSDPATDCVVRGIDVKNVFYIFYLCHVFYVF